MVSAAHQFSKASINFILTKVRQELYSGLQKINKKEINEINEIKEVSSSPEKRTVLKRCITVAVVAKTPLNYRRKPLQFGQRNY